MSLFSRRISRFLKFGQVAIRRFSASSCECKDDSANTGCLRDKLIYSYRDVPQPASNKITIVGVGNVGMSIATILLAQKLTTELCLIDSNEKRMKGEVLDFLHAAAQLHDCNVSGGNDYTQTECSRICIITAGKPGPLKPGESRLDLIDANAVIVTNIVKQLIKYSPNTILIMVSNPVDVLTYVAWKVSGLPCYRVIGTGCVLDSSRFRLEISKRLGVAPTSVKGYIIGEHGDSSVPVWSSVTVGGARLMDMHPSIGTDKDAEKWGEIHKTVVAGAKTVVSYKTYTSSAIAACTCALVSSIYDNARHILPVTISAKNLHCINEDIFLSLPAILDGFGLHSVIRLPLLKDEQEQLHKSADVLYKVQKNTKI